MLTRLMVAVGIIASIGASNGVWSDLSRERGSVAAGDPILPRIIEGEVLANARGQAAEPDPPPTEPVRVQAEESTEPALSPTPTSTPVFYRADLGTVHAPNRVVETETPTEPPPTEPTDEPANANLVESDTVPVRVRIDEPTEEPTARKEPTRRPRPTEAPDLPRPTRDLPVLPRGGIDGNGEESNLLVYVAAGAVLVLAAGASIVSGIVFGKRRSKR